MQKNKSKIILLAVILIIVAIYFFVPSIKSTVDTSIQVLTTNTLDTGIDGVINYIRSYGVYAVIISFFMMVLQSIIAPIPAFLITLSNAAIFGWVKGAILSWSSAMVGAMLCFMIAKILGRDAVDKLTGKNVVKSVDTFFEKYGKYAILVARLLPFVSFDIVSYAAGLTSMSFSSFLIATGIGQLPATIVYSYVGGNFSGGAKKLFIALLCLFALSIIIYVWRKIYSERQNKKNI